MRKPSPWSRLALNLHPVARSPGTLSESSVPAPLLLFGLRVKTPPRGFAVEMKVTNPVTSAWHMLHKCWFSFFVNKDNALTTHETCVTLSADMPSFLFV